MADKKVLEEVKYRKALGNKNILALKRELFLKGYKPKDIDEAVEEIYKDELKLFKKNIKSPPKQSSPNPIANNEDPASKKKIVISTKTIVISSVLFILVILIALFMVFSDKSKEDPEPLDPVIEDPSEGNIEEESFQLTLKDFSKEISLGSQLPIAVEVSNFNSDSPLSFSIKIEISDLKGTQYPQMTKVEPISASLQSTLATSLDTSQLKEGTYKLKISTDYLDSEKKVVEYFQILNDPLFIDPISVQTSCTQNSQCNANNSCTTGKCESEVCVYEPKLTCCGNYLCEENETESNCNVDCKPLSLSGENTSDIDRIKEALTQARSNPTTASQLCASIQEAVNRDACFVAIAQNASRPQFCSQIITPSKKDDCYLALASKSRPVCNQIQDSLKREGCLAMISI